MNIEIKDMDRGEDISDKINETEKKIYEDIHNKLIKSGYICKSGRYHYKGEKVIIGFANLQGEDRGFVIRMRLPKLPNYSLNLDILSERVMECILNGKECHPCYFGKGNETCGKEYIFKFQDKSYIKCRLAYENFKFYGLSEEDISSIEKLIDNEIFYLTKPNPKKFLKNEKNMS